ncbi:alpha/beta fold hydrolase [Flammeovirga sp. MY04]|uniref:alpha/beta fold hydrolase n=1 Tax=Flammeovirga sp. MY04 TaxID=1191459 RepID=UPI0008061A09|nr:alpha/beta fold hydrolase [Flammeovirga sp. MY04]ANQ48741.1 alpha/beta fold hydrolase [Flammeovirga sp. MY04]
MNAYDHGYLITEDGHELYYEQSGHPMGVPVLYLHGGPGAGLGDAYIEIFKNTPAVRLIGIDQRGSGNSKPLGSLKNNTLAHLIKDLELLRTTLHINEWYIFGGSWGSTLALAYTSLHQERVKGLNLWGIFFCNQNELEWLFTGATPTMYADVASVLHDGVDRRSLTQFLNSYRKAMDGDDFEKFCTNWLLWESFASEHPHSNYEELYQWSPTKYAIACARIENHYFLQSPYLFNNQSIEDLITSSKIICPVYITHGRNDLVTPSKSALQLHEMLPNSQLNIIDKSGHSLSHPYMMESVMKFGQELLSHSLD